MDDLNKPTCNLSAKSPRAGDWVKVFNRLHNIPITGWLPMRANLPGKPNAEVYMLDLTRITPDERTRLVEHISRRFDIPLAEVEQALDHEGVPLLAEDISVAIPLRLLI